MGGFGGLGSGGGGGSGGNAILSSLLTSAQSRASSLMAKAASFFTKFTPFCFTRVVVSGAGWELARMFFCTDIFSFLLSQENLAEGRSCPEDDSFLYLDPRSGLSHNSSSSSKGEKYSDVIVFVLGGGCYSGNNSIVIE